MFFSQDVRFDTFFTERGVAWVPFLIYGTGCDALSLTATSLSAAGVVESTLKKSVAFGCGE